MRSGDLRYLAGTVSDGEEPEAAALRELGEETGFAPASRC